MNNLQQGGRGRVMGIYRGERGLGFFKKKIRKPPNFPVTP